MLAFIGGVVVGSVGLALICCCMVSGKNREDEE